MLDVYVYGIRGSVRELMLNNWVIGFLANRQEAVVVNANSLPVFWLLLKFLIRKDQSWAPHCAYQFNRTMEYVRTHHTIHFFD